MKIKILMAMIAVGLFTTPLIYANDNTDNNSGTVNNNSSMNNNSGNNTDTGSTDTATGDDSY